MLHEKRIHTTPDLLTVLIIAQKTRTRLTTSIHSILNEYINPSVTLKKSWFVFNRNFSTYTNYQLENKN